MKQLNLIQLILNKVAQEALQEANKPHTIGVYRASEIGGCGRALQYATLKYTAEALTPETHLIFKDGHIHHHAVRELLGKVGTLSNVEMSISKQYRHNGQKFTITGTVDCVFNRIVIDIKSISTYRFKYLDRAFPGEYLNYVDQIQIYMDMLNLERGGILFKDKNTAELKIFYLDNDKDLMLAILNRVAEIHKGIRAKKLIARPYGRDTWHCKLCPYRLPCWRLPMEVRSWKAREGVKDARRQAQIAKLRETLKGD